MLAYKNLSNTTKTFYGVTFKPGEIKEVPGYINVNCFVKVDSVPKEPPKRTGNKKDDKPADKPAENEIKEEKLDGTDSNK